MAAETLEPIPGDDILHAVGELGAEIERVEEITRLKTARNRRACFRLQLTDGRTVKGRRFHSREQRETATNVAPLLAGLPFSRVVATRGAACIEEWIPGAPVVPNEMSMQLVGDLAHVLGTLHTREFPPHLTPPDVPDQSWYVARLAEQLGVLRDQNQIGAETAAGLMDRATQRAAGSLEIGVTHTDFHPRNMIATRDSGVWIVDNEDIRIGPLDYDLARCWRQWPMTPAQREAFCDAYAKTRNLESFLAHAEFWSICTLVNTARIHLRFLEPIEAFVALLEAISLNDEAALWPDFE